jgi:hypothetical protein
MSIEVMDARLKEDRDGLSQRLSTSDMDPRAGFGTMISSNPMLFMEARSRGHLPLRCLEDIEKADESDCLRCKDKDEDSEEDPDPRGLSFEVGKDDRYTLLDLGTWISRAKPSTTFQTVPSSKRATRDSQEASGTTLKQKYSPC